MPPRRVLYFLLDLPGRRPLAALQAFLPRMAGSWDAFDLIQVRAKEGGAGEFAAALQRLGEELASEAGSQPILANDRLDVALASGADGVHLGAADLAPERIRELDLPAGFVIGLTCHDLPELERATDQGVDYVGVGAFFPSPTKRVSPSDPRRALRALPASYPLPVYAIGGITLEGLDEVLATPHVAGVVVSSAIQLADEPAAWARRFRERLDASG